MILLILILIFQTSSPVVYALNNQIYFAKVLFEQVYLYKTPTNNNDVSNILFELPKTYFVQLEEASGEFYKAKYLDTTGYVKKDCVQAIIGSPKQPFLELNFRVYADLSTQLKTTPTSTSNSIVKIPLLTKNICYYGKINGETLIEGRTSVWFYCKYETNTESYFGYVYSDFCDEMPNEIPLNNEKVEFTNNPTFEVIITPVKSIPITNNSVGIIIGILSIPALIFVFMIIKGSKILSREKYQSKEIIDY